MANQRLEPVETPLGILKGRDAIYLDDLDFNAKQGTVRLEGIFNGHLATLPRDDMPAYTIVFSEVLALKIIELDSMAFGGTSSFDEVVNSDWCAQLGGKVNSSHRHYRIQTYDDVIEVVCRGLKLELKSGK